MIGAKYAKPTTTTTNAMAIARLGLMAKACGADPIYTLLETFLHHPPCNAASSHPEMQQHRAFLT